MSTTIKNVNSENLTTFASLVKGTIEDTKTQWNENLSTVAQGLENSISTQITAIDNINEKIQSFSVSLTDSYGDTALGASNGELRLNFTNAENQVTSFNLIGMGAASVTCETRNSINVTVPVASDWVLGAIKLGYAENSNNIALQLNSNNEAFVTVPVASDAPTLNWGTTSTIGSVAGTQFKVTMPSNPNTDTKNTVGSDISTAQLYLIGVTSTSVGEANSNTTSRSYTTNNVYVQDGAIYGKIHVYGSGGNFQIYAANTYSNNTGYLQFLTE